MVFARPAAGDAPRVEGLDVRRAVAADGPGYERWIGTDSARTFADRLSAKTRCYLVMADERIVHASWVTTAAAWTRELRAYLRPPPGDAYVYESVTRADARGMGAYPIALRYVCADLARDGIGDVWVAVEEDNPASTRAVTKAGFEPRFRISYRRRWGTLKVRVDNGVTPGHRWVAKEP